MARQKSLFKAAITTSRDPRRRTLRYLVTVHSCGVRERKYFDEKKKAEGWIETRRAEVQKLGVEVRQSPREEVLDALAARKRLGEDGGRLEDAVGELLLARDVLGRGKGLLDVLEALKGARSVLGSGKALLDALEDAKVAKKALGGRITLRGAADFWLAHNPDGKAATLGEAIEAYLSDLPHGGSAPSHVRGLRQKLKSLREALGEETPVASIMQSDVQNLLDELAEEREWTGLTHNHWRVTIASFFSFAAREYGTGNPAAGIRAKKVEQRTILYYSPEQAEALLRAAEEIAPQYCAALALLLFAGIRPTELIGQYGLEGEGKLLGGLTWQRVDTEDGEIVIDASVAKTTQRRTIPISDNLSEWLARYGQERGRIVPNPTAWRRVRAKIAKAAGVEWGPDWARHSFATYYYALHRDRAALEAAMGHVEGGGAAVLENHYKGLEKRSTAARYWNIMPSEEEV